MEVSEQFVVDHVKGKYINVPMALNQADIEHPLTNAFADYWPKEVKR
jgi:hypothetical protein